MNVQGERRLCFVQPMGRSGSLLLVRSLDGFVLISELHDGRQEALYRAEAAHLEFIDQGWFPVAGL
jgi:hypothetical protein